MWRALRHYDLVAVGGWRRDQARHFALNFGRKHTRFDVLVRRAPRWAQRGLAACKQRQCTAAKTKTLEGPSHPNKVAARRSPATQAQRRITRFIFEKRAFRDARARSAELLWELASRVLQCTHATRPRAHLTSAVEAAMLYFPTHEDALTVVDVPVLIS